MTDAFTIDPARTALVAMDYQASILGGFVAEPGALLARASAVLDAGRSAKLRIVYVVVGFRDGSPEISPRNASFSTIRGTRRFQPDDAGAAIHPDVAPQPGDVTVIKHRVSAFAGTDFDMILRANGVETLILMGVATSGVVLSTVRHAADADYRVVVVEDCCSDRDAEVHRVLVEKVFPRQATVVTSERIVEALRGTSRS
jgi:nicotinamidase-related amidase